MTHPEVHQGLEALAGLKETIRKLTRPAILLLVEDNDADVKLLEHSLLKFRIDLSTAANAKDAIRLFGTKQYDVVLLDLVLGHESGLPVIEHIRRVTKAIPIIVLTGHPDDSPIANDAMAAGATCVFRKPMTESQLSLIFGAI